MNDNTAKLLEQLASKLGTTSEYLWFILVRQAPISATIDVIYIIITGLLWMLLYKLHKHFSDRNNVFNYDSDDVSTATSAVMINIVGFAFVLIATLMSFFSLQDIFNGYFNPEFWALNYIIDHLK